MHNKFIVSVLIAVVLGSIIGHTLFKKYQQEDIEVFNENNSVYLLQEGVYDNEERAKNATTNIDTKLIVKQDAKYYAYLALTKNKHNLDRLKKYFNKQNINITVKEITIDNEAFLTSLSQMDGLMEQVDSNEEMITINRVILANYEELILKQ